MFDERAFNAAIAMAGSSHDEAARVMGMNPATLSRKKKGESDFYRKEIEAFCTYYHASPKIFFAEESA